MLNIAKLQKLCTNQRYPWIGNGVGTPRFRLVIVEGYLQFFSSFQVSVNTIGASFGFVECSNLWELCLASMGSKHFFLVCLLGISSVLFSVNRGSF